MRAAGSAAATSSCIAALAIGLPLTGLLNSSCDRAFGPRTGSRPSLHAPSARSPARAGRGFSPAPRLCGRTLAQRRRAPLPYGAAVAFGGVWTFLSAFGHLTCHLRCVSRHRCAAPSPRPRSASSPTTPASKPRPAVIARPRLPAVVDGYLVAAPTLPEGDAGARRGFRGPFRRHAGRRDAWGAPRYAARRGPARRGRGATIPRRRAARLRRTISCVRATEVLSLASSSRYARRQHQGRFRIRRLGPHLAGDFVDVVLTQANDKADSAHRMLSETFCAISASSRSTRTSYRAPRAARTPRPGDARRGGAHSVSLEVQPEQVKTMAVAKDLGKLSLADSAGGRASGRQVNSGTVFGCNVSQEIAREHASAGKVATVVVFAGRQEARNSRS